MDELNNTPELGLIGSTIKTYLDSNDYNYDISPDNESFELRFNLENDRVRLRIVFNEEKEWFCAIVYPSHAIPLKQIDKILPKLNEINCNALFGAFFVDPADGELAFRCTATADDRSINETMVAVMLSTALTTADNNINDIMKALYA